MSVDPIANMIVKIKNAVTARHYKVDIPLSKVKMEIIRLFRDEGFISNFKLVEGKHYNLIRVFLKYSKQDEAVITDIKRVSKQGCRIYKKACDIPRILNGLGVVIVSTSKGVVTGKKAREELRVGGEIICYIW